MYNAISRSQIFVLDQDEALNFYTDVLGLEVAADVDLGFMRWLTVRVPGDPVREILLERPGPPSMDEATAAQVRDLVTKGAMGGSLFLTTDDAHGDVQDPEGARRRRHRRAARRGPTASTSASATRSATPSASARCSTDTSPRATTSNERLRPRACNDPGMELHAEAEALDSTGRAGGYPRCPSSASRQSVMRSLSSPAPKLPILIESLIARNREIHEVSASTSTRRPT